MYFFVYNGRPPPFMISNMTGTITVNGTLDQDDPLTRLFQMDIIARDKGIPAEEVVTVTIGVAPAVCLCMK